MERGKKLRMELSPASSTKTGDSATPAERAITARAIVFFGNCQCEYLYRLYKNQIAPFTDDKVIYIDIVRYPEGADDIAGADILVDQTFDAPDLFSSEALKPGAQRIRIPNIRGDFLWPYTRRDPHPKAATFHHRTKLYYSAEYGDSYLAGMVIKNVPAELVPQRYLAVDLIRERHIDRMFELTLDRQRKRDERAGVNIADFIETHFRTERLFESPGHPTEPLLALLARAALAPITGEAEVDRALKGHSEAYEPCHRCPIHPGVIRYYGLTFVHDDSRYGMENEGAFSFVEYVMRYMRGESVPELREAFDLAGQENAARALEILDRAILKAPGSWAAHRVRSGMLRKLGRAGQSVEPALRAVALMPEDANNFIELIRSARAAGQLLLAERFGRTAVDLFPRNAHVFHALSSVLVALNRLEEGRQLLQRAIDLLPAFPAAINELAYLSMVAGDLVQAEALARRAIAQDSGLIQAHAVLADALKRQGRAREAIPYLQGLIAEGTAKPEVYVQLANCLVSEGEVQEAEELLRNAPQFGADPSLRAAQTLVLYRLERRAEAIALLREVIEQAPDNPHFLARLGNWLLQEGDVAGAEAPLRRSIELDPSPGWNALTEVLARQERLPEAIAVVRDVISRGMSDAEIFARLGHLLWRHQEFPAAEKAYRRAAELSPAPRFRIGLAESIVKQGRAREAAAILREAAEGSQDAQLYFRLGELLRRDDPASAQAAFRRATELSPDPVFQEALARAMEQEAAA